MGNLGQFWEIYGDGEKFTGMGGKSVTANSATNGSCPVSGGRPTVTMPYVCLAYNATSYSLLVKASKYHILSFVEEKNPFVTHYCMGTYMTLFRHASVSSTYPSQM